MKPKPTRAQVAQARDGYRRLLAYRGDGAPVEDAINVLQCAFCAEWFPTFERLAKHTTLRHGRVGSSERIQADRARETRQQEKRPMAKKKAPQRASGALPEPSTSDRDDLPPFIKADDVGDLGETATFHFQGKVRVVDGSYGEQAVCAIKHAGRLYDWGVKTGSPSYRLLVEKFGRNPAKWKGPVSVTIKENLGKHYIAVDRPR